MATEPLVLRVSLSEATFGKPVAWFIVLELDEEEATEQRTDLSKPSTTPAFEKRDFEFKIQGQ